MNEKLKEQDEKITVGNKKIIELTCTLETLKEIFKAYIG